MKNQKIDLALFFLQARPRSAARVLEQQPIDVVASFLKSLPHHYVALVLTYMLPQYTARICAHFDPAFSASIFSSMNIQIITSILRYSEASVKLKIFKFLPDKVKIACKLLLTYSEELVGAWMMVDIPTLPNDCTVEEALLMLTSEYKLTYTNNVYVVDRDGFLQGMVNIISLLSAMKVASIATVMKRKPDVLSGRTSLISASKHPVWEKGDVVAIVNRDQKIIGVLRHVDLRKALSALSTTVIEPSYRESLSNVFEVYGNSLFAFFSSMIEVMSINRE